MFEPLLTQPEIFTITGPSSIKVKLKETVSDVGLLQAINGHIGEFIIVQVNTSSLSVLYRTHPFLSVDIISRSPIDICTTSSLARSSGQGWRLFTGLGVSPRLCSEQLRAGLMVNIQFDQQAHFEMNDVNHWNLVSLEDDIRVFHEPKEMMRAKSLLSREVIHVRTTEQILIELSELETIRDELVRFSQSELAIGHHDLKIEVLKLDSQLEHKKQWLTRSFNQSIERQNWNDASNQTVANDVLVRKLEYYRLLSTPAVNDMVHQLIIGEE